MRILDLASSIAPNLPTKIIGIRPGEKLHETMCPADDSHLTIEFEDHYVLSPSIVFYSEDVDFSRNPLGEIGRFVEQGFEYNSGSNPHFLTVGELSDLNNRVLQ